jgi:hypothetical protein
LTKSSSTAPLNTTTSASLPLNDLSAEKLLPDDLETNRVARFLLMQFTKMGIIYQMDTTRTKWT